MKNTLSLSLLLLASQAIAKEPQSKPSELFRRIADEMDKVGEEINQVGEEVSSFGVTFAQEIDSFFQEAGTRAEKVKSALSQTESNITVKDEKDAVFINAQIGDIAPNEDANITVIGDSFKVEMKDGGNRIEIAGSIDRNLVVAQIIGYQERTTKNGATESNAVQSSVIQRTIIDTLELEKLSADFTKANKTLTIRIPKKKTLEEEIRKVAVNIK